MDPFPGILDAGSDKEFPWVKGFFIKKMVDNPVWSGIFGTHTIMNVKNRTRSWAGTASGIPPGSISRQLCHPWSWPAGLKKILIRSQIWEKINYSGDFLPV
jgi:hypothetical protein